MWLHLSLLGLCLAVATAPAEEATELVRKLGSPEFAEREVAEKGLLRLGPAALPAVRTGLRSDDPEVRSRCQRLLPPLEAAEWRQKADAFAADRDGKWRHNLPLWDEYEKLVGADSAARELFARMVRANGRLLQKVTADPARGQDDYRSECRALYEAGRAAETGQLAALLLVSLVLKEHRADDREPTCFAHLFGNPGLREAARDREVGKPLGRMLLRWADQQARGEETSLRCFLYFVNAARWKEGLPVVRQLIRPNTAVGLYLKAAAITVLVSLEDKGAAAGLEKLWGYEIVLFTYIERERANARLGDQALAASIRLAGKDPKDYGMKEANLTLAGPGRGWEAPIYWFASDSDRKAALKKWKSRKAK